MMSAAPAQSAALSQEMGVIDTTFLVRELKRKKFMIFRMSATLALLALMFALKPNHPNIKATLRVDPPSLSIGAMYNVDTEIGSIKSYSTVEQALARADYYAEVLPLDFRPIDENEAEPHAMPGALHFRHLYFPPVMVGREWLIEVIDANHYELQTYDGEVITEGAAGELLTGSAMTEDDAEGSGNYRVQINAIKAAPGSRFLIQPKTTDGLVRQILQELDVTKRSSSPGSNLIDIELAMKDPALSYLVVKHLAEGYITDSIARQSAAQQKAITKLEVSLKELELEVDERKQALLDFFDRTKVVNPEIEARNLLQQQLELTERLKEAQVRLTQLELIYTDQHPAIRAVKSEILLYEASLDELRGTIAVLPAYRSQLEQLQRDLTISSDLYQTAIKELARARLETNRLPQSVHLIDAPRMHKQGRAKYVIQLMIFGGMLGLITGLALVLLAASMRLGRLYMLAQLQPLTKLPVNQDVLSLKQMKLSPEAKAKLVQWVKYSFRQNEKLIIGCSSSTQQTKTAKLTLAFANALSEQHRTLLIDAHLYHSPLAPLLEMEGKQGLSEWLAGITPIEQLIKPTRRANLFYLPAGEELLNYDLLRDADVLKAKLDSLGYDAMILFLPEPEALPAPTAIYEHCSRIIHWIELFTTLERLHQYLGWFESLSKPKQNLFVYELDAGKQPKPATVKSPKPMAKRRATSSSGRVFVG